VLLGNTASMHPNFSALRALAEAIATETKSVFGYLSEGSNSAGAWLAGAVPHRGPAGLIEDVVQGFDAGAIAVQKPAAALLVNVEPDADCVQAAAIINTLNQCHAVVAISAFDSPALRDTATVLLPASTFAETSGTYVNAEGVWQSFRGACKPLDDARPTWKILRVLGNLLNKKGSATGGFEFLSSEEVRDELRGLCENIELSNALSKPVAINLDASESDKKRATDMKRGGDVPIYAGDAVLRRAVSLQKTADAQAICVRINTAEATRLGVLGSDSVLARQGEQSFKLDLVVDESIPTGTAWIPMAVKGNELLGDAFGDVVIEPITEPAKENA